jgi:hypothetical protein
MEYGDGIGRGGQSDGARRLQVSIHLNMIIVKSGIELRTSSIDSPLSNVRTATKCWRSSRCANF